MLIVGFLVAYDYALLQSSIPLVYAEANRIVLSVDEHWLTWSGQPFSIKKDFYDWLAEIDTEHKIVWEKGNYADTSKNPLENETLQRNDMFRNHPGYDWYIQLDADEYFVSFAAFTTWLNSIEVQNPTGVSVHWKTIFKIHENNYFLVAGKSERISVCTNFPHYSKARFSESWELKESAFVLVHQSWGRTKYDVIKKLTNWGHRDDFNHTAFLEKWKRCNKFTYALYRYFHPLHAPIWPYLEKVQADSIPALIEHYRRQPPVEQPVPTLSWPQKILKKILGI